MKERKRIERTVKIFDTTLRDGEQSPGVSLTPEQKVQIALNLQRLGADIIEAGFPASSEGDFEGVKKVAKIITDCQVAALCMANKSAVEKAWSAIKDAVDPRIHTFIATSDIHLEHKLKITRKEAIARAVEAVRYARTLTKNVQFSAEDGSRSDPDFLCRIFEAVIKAGATTVNLPDTVGYAVPEEFGELVKYVLANTEGIQNVTLSVHCHNDLGMATANTLAAIKAGAGQAEVTINGIGERAGNTSLEEVVMSMKTRGDFFGADTRINTEKIFPICRFVSNTTGISIQPNRAVVGDNAFSHESGIHQDGMLKNPMTYQIMTPESIGIVKSDTIVLGKHSGRKALRSRLKKLGYSLSNEEIGIAFKKMKALADRKSKIEDEDLEIIIAEVMKKTEKYELKCLQIAAGTHVTPLAVMRISIDGVDKEGFDNGNGPVDAAYKFIAKITERSFELDNYNIKSITEGSDALSSVSVIIKDENGVTAFGIGSDTDIITASVKALLDALNRLEYIIKNPPPIGTELPFKK